MKQIINGVSYHYSIYGEGDPLLLLHGFTGNIGTWNSFLPEWGKSFQLIMVDIIGHGKTDSPTDPARYEIDKVATDIHDLLVSYHIDSINVLGYSMGGRLALSFACQYPEMVKSLILESSSPGLMTERERMIRNENDLALANRIEAGGLEAFIEYWENIPLFSQVKKLPAEIQVKIRQERLAQSVTGLANSLRGMGTGKQPSYWSCFPKFNIPVLLISGSEDVKFLGIANEMEKLLSKVKKTTIQGSGHMIHVEKQEIFGRTILNWLLQVQNT